MASWRIDHNLKWNVLLSRSPTTLYGSLSTSVLYLFWIYWHNSFQQAINFLQTREYNICAIINKHRAWYCNCASRVVGSKRKSWWISCNADLVADDILTLKFVTVNRAVVHLQMQIAANYRCGHWHIFSYISEVAWPCPWTKQSNQGTVSTPRTLEAIVVNGTRRMPSWLKRLKTN